MNWTEFLRSANGGLSNPAPKPPAAYLVECANVHVEKFRQLIRRDGRRADRPNLLFGQARATDLTPARLSAVLDLIADIFGGSRPAQIGRDIVERVAVIVRGMMLGSRRGAVERLANEPMHRCVNHPALIVEADPSVAPASSAPSLVQYSPGNSPAARMRTACIPTDLSAIRNAVVRRAGDCFPNFGAMSYDSHGAVPSHCGQGRALRKQRFRPAFYAPIPVITQGNQAA